MKTLLMSFLLAASPYPTSFVCKTAENPECPHKQNCPVLPPGSRGCGIAPGGIGAEHVPPGVWPVACRVSLPYGDPSSGGRQKVCTCREEGEGKAKTVKRFWDCA